MIPHIEQVLQLAETEKILHPTGILMGEKLGVYVYLQGDVSKAEELFRRGLAIDEAHFGKGGRISLDGTVRLPDDCFFLGVVEPLAKPEPIRKDLRRPRRK